MTEKNSAIAKILFLKSTQLVAVLIGLLSVGVVTTNAYAMDLKSWDNQVNAAGRFVVLNAFDTYAVLDKETQLVWQRVIEAEKRVDFDRARRECLNATTGNRKGWRLPTNYEIASLVDPAEVKISFPPLPAGHPFEINAKEYYWATSEKGAPAKAWAWSGTTGTVTDKIPSGALYWCVRGH